MASLEKLLKNHLRKSDGKADTDGSTPFDVVAHLDLDECSYFLIKSPKTPRDELTNCEKKISQLVSSGLSNKEIAAKLDLSRNTVRIYLHKIFKKLNLESRTELVRYFALNYPMDFFFIQ